MFRNLYNQSSNMFEETVACNMWRARRSFHQTSDTDIPCINEQISMLMMKSWVHRQVDVGFVHYCPRPVPSCACNIFSGYKIFYWGIFACDRSTPQQRPSVSASVPNGVWPTYKFWLLYFSQVPHDCVSCLLCPADLMLVRVRQFMR